MAKCKLCLEESELRNSHIIPEFFYKPMYDDQHRFMQISTVPEEQGRFLQRGIREHLLCGNCEQKFSTYERYVSQLFYHQEPNRIEYGEGSIIVHDVNYPMMKLFQLSVLWRAAVSNLELFNEVKLGPHEEYLRKMLLAEKPGKDFEYGCIQVGIIMDEEKLADGLIMPPAQFRIDGFKHCRFTFGGLIWIYIISNHNKQYRWNNHFLHENECLTIHTKMIDEIKYIMDFGLALKHQGKLKG